MKTFVLAPHPGFTINDEANQVYLETQKDLSIRFLSAFYDLKPEYADALYQLITDDETLTYTGELITVDLSYCEVQEIPIGTVFSYTDPDKPLEAPNLLRNVLALPSREAVHKTLPKEALKL